MAAAKKELSDAEILESKDIEFIVESSNKADQQKLDNAVYKGIVEGT